MSWIVRFLRLTWADKVLLVQAVLLLTAVRVGLSLLPFQTLRKLLAGAAKAPASSIVQKNPANQPPRVIWAVAVAGRSFPSIGTCLMQAFAAHVLLGRRHYPTQLRIGVTRNEKGKFLGHAWLEREGTVIIGGDALKEQHYTPLLAMDHLGSHEVIDVDAT